jgi:hypothetical protein
MACQSLLSGECDMALAGGVTVELPHGRGYLFEGRDPVARRALPRLRPPRAGHGVRLGCGLRAAASGAGCDCRWRPYLGHHQGHAVNNDGAAKAGYLAPSVDGQAAAVAEAIAVAGVPAETIGYVECHGTGTYLGDPIEVAALTQAFRRTTDRAGLLPDRQRQDEHRASGHRGRRRQPDQGGAGAASRADAAQPELRGAQSGHRLRGSPFRVADRLLRSRRLARRAGRG